MFKRFQHKTINLEEVEGILILIREDAKFARARKDYYVFNEQAFCELLDRESHNGWVFAGIIKSVSENCDFSIPRFDPNPIFPHTILLRHELLSADPYREQ